MYTDDYSVFFEVTDLGNLSRSWDDYLIAGMTTICALGSLLCTQG